MKTYVDFVRANSEYLSRADEYGLSIHDELTFGCWVWFDAESTDVATGIIGKWLEAGNERAYVIYKSASNVITLSISNTGADEFTVDSDELPYYESQWYYVVGRLTPGSELALFVNGMWYITTAGIPATVFHSSQDFEIGRYNAGNYLDGRVSQAFISAYSIPDRFICSMYAHAKALYMNKFPFQAWCSSTSSSSSSSSSSTTSSSSSSVPP